MMKQNSNRNYVTEQMLQVSNWKPARKKLYEVYVCMPSIGCKVHNKLEGTNYQTDQNRRFVISGTVGEQWVIDINKLANTYEFESGEPITVQGIAKRSHNGIMDWVKVRTKRQNTGMNWAFFLPKSIKNFSVQTSWGDVLLANRDGISHDAGDFILSSDFGGAPNIKDIWVVNGLIYANTYDMRTFSSIKMDNNGGKTPYPSMIVQ